MDLKFKYNQSFNFYSPPPPPKKQPRGSYILWRRLELFLSLFVRNSCVTPLCEMHRLESCKTFALEYGREVLRLWNFNMKIWTQWIKLTWRTCLFFIFKSHSKLKKNLVFWKPEVVFFFGGGGVDFPPVKGNRSCL